MPTRTRYSDDWVMGAPFPSLAPHRGASVVPVLALLGATSHRTLAPRQPRGGAVHRRCCLRTGGSWHSPRGGRVATSEMVQGEVAPALDLRVLLRSAWRNTSPRAGRVGIWLRHRRCPTGR